MTIHFNPAYNAGYYVADPVEGTAVFSEKYVGAEGLLQELELRAGLTVPDRPRHEMLSLYLQAADDAVKDDPDIFFAPSFRLTSLRTAEKLLAWRDELVLAGWTATTVLPEDLTSGGRSILQGLAAIEKRLGDGFRTDADRWIRLGDALSGYPLTAGLDIVLDVPETHLHPRFCSILELLRRQGAPVRACETGGSAPATQVKHFRNEVDACLWAACEVSKEQLIVCEDTLTLGNAMLALGKSPAAMVSKASLRPVEHLFTDAMLLLADAQNSEILRDYLSVSPHPLNHPEKDGRTLRYDLLRHLVSQGGFGENSWTGNTFYTIIEDYADGDAEVMKRIRSFLPEKGNPLTFARIKALCSSLSAWASGCIRNVPQAPENASMLSQWGALSGFCTKMLELCKEMGFDKMETIGRSDFMKVLKSACTAEDSNICPACRGAAPTVSRIAGIASEVSSAIWIDPAPDAIRLPLDFLCEADTARLAGILDCVWRQQEALLFADDAFCAGLSRIKGQLTILCCDGADDEKHEIHPFLLQQKIRPTDIAYECIPKERTEPCVPRPAETAKEEYSLDGSAVTIPASEGPTSLETMFSCPFDWLIERVLGLSSEYDENMSRTEGLVAHAVIHSICLLAAPDGGDVSPAAFRKIFTERFDELFEEAVSSCGAALNLPKNKIERDQFEVTLRNRSLPGLIGILEGSGLTITGSETVFREVDISEPGYEPLRITAVVDLLVRDRSGNHRVIDFKWTGSNTGRDDRMDQIKKGKDYQLAIYRKVLERDRHLSVTAQAFYMLRSAELLTSSTLFRDGNGKEIHPVEHGKKWQDYEDTMKEIYTRYTETVRALRGGTVACPKVKYDNNPVLKGNMI